MGKKKHRVLEDEKRKERTKRTFLQSNANGNGPKGSGNTGFLLTMNIFMQQNPFLRLVSRCCDLAYFLQQCLVISN